MGRRLRHAVDRIDDEAQLRALLGEPEPRAYAKEVDRLDEHCAAFLARSPLALVATAGGDGRADASPRGGPPGFVRVLDERRLAWGELPSNRRADSLSNLLANPWIGLLFLVPRYGETLRVNGSAWLTREPALLERVALDGRPPRLAVVVDVEVAFLQCAKALRRSRLWESEAWPALDGLAPPAQVYRDHRRDGSTAEQVEAQLAESYARRVWWPAGSGTGEA